MNKLRKLAIWLVGRDLLESTVPICTIGTVVIRSPPEPRWEFRFSKAANSVIHQASGPNALHRTMQSVVLGVSWRMLPLTAYRQAQTEYTNVTPETVYEESQ